MRLADEIALRMADQKWPFIWHSEGISFTSPVTGGRGIIPAAVLEDTEEAENDLRIVFLQLVVVYGLDPFTEDPRGETPFLN